MLQFLDELLRLLRLQALAQERDTLQGIVLV